MKPKIAIIGGSGFIGLSLAKHLRKRFSIRVLDVKPPFGAIDYQYCDIRNFGKLAENLEDIDLVIHSAIIQIPRINENIQLGYEVNISGTENVCEAVEQNSRIKGMLLTGTWHTMGERDISGIINEEFGFRPDKVEARAKLYVLSKIPQESIVRFHDEMSNKIFGVLRLGTVLGDGMPEKTAASLFIEQGFGPKSTITPYKHSMHRPMLYVDIDDICRAFENYVDLILSDGIEERKNSLSHIVNVYHPELMTILELAQSVRDSIIESTKRKIVPQLKIVDSGEETLFKANDKDQIQVDISKVKSFLNLKNLKNPQQSIRELVRKYPERPRTKKIDLLKNHEIADIELFAQKLKVYRENKKLFEESGFTYPIAAKILRKAWLTTWDSYYLFSHARRIPNNGAYLEIGTWLGGSVLSAFLATQMSKTSVSFTVIDVGVEAAHFVEVMKMIPDIRFVLFRSDLAKDKIQNNSIDLLFIDGAHHYHQVKRDIINYWPKLKIGGVLLGHDFSKQKVHRGIVQAVNEIFGKNSILLKNSRIFKVEKISKELR